MLDMAELLKWSLAVTGQGLWFAIQLVPLCIVYLVFSILSLAGMMLSEIADNIQTALTYSSERMVLAFQWCYLFVTDFPVEAVLGFITGFAIVCWSHKNRTAIRNISSRVIWKVGMMVRSGIG